MPGPSHPDLGSADRDQGGRLTFRHRAHMNRRRRHTCARSVARSCSPAPGRRRPSISRWLAAIEKPEWAAFPRRSATWQYGREYGCTNIAVQLMMQLASGAVRLPHRGKPDMPPVVTDEERSTRAIQLLKSENWPTPKNGLWMGRREKFKHTKSTSLFNCGLGIRNLKTTFVPFSAIFPISPT